ncbi:sugar diacid recognition domain-containing protein [Aminivibrio sp.]
MLSSMAQDIAGTVSAIIGYAVLVTDEKGVIIGSSDPARRGTLHLPSLAVMKEQRPLSTTEEESRALPGVRAGFTLPILLGGEVAGSIAIAGPPEFVEKFGLLVQKQAEIMLREQALLQWNLLRERALKGLAEGIASFEEGEDEEILLLQGRELGFDLRIPRTAVALGLIDVPEGQSGEGMGRALDVLRKVWPGGRNIYCPLSDVRAALFLAWDGRDREGTELLLGEKCAEGVSLLAEQGIALAAGIGSPARGVAELGKSCREGKEALLLGRRLKRTERVFSARKNGVESLLASIQGKKREEFAERVLGGLRKRPDFAELAATFRAWCADPFHSGAVADRLSLHRNSLTYRLKKIREETNLSPWDFRECLQLLLALYLQDFTESGKQETHPGTPREGE